MPIPLPNLDNRTYADLVDEARSLIPGLCPAWTNHNPSDPGIMLIELFAWLTEMLLYRVDQIPDEHYRAFLKLLVGPTEWTNYEGLTTEEAIRRVVLMLRAPYRVVTERDYEVLALSTAGHGLDKLIARARCIGNCNLEAKPPWNRPGQAPAFISMIVVPALLTVRKPFSLEPGQKHGVEVSASAWEALQSPQEGHDDHAPGELRVRLRCVPGNLAQALAVEGEGCETLSRTAGFGQGESEWRFHVAEQADTAGATVAPISLTIEQPQVQEGGSADRIQGEVELTYFPRRLGLDGLRELCTARRLLTTRSVVVDPSYVPFSVKATLRLKDDALAATVRREAVARLGRHFHPLWGGRDGKGWPFGRDVYLSEVYDLLDRVPGVDGARDVSLRREEGRRWDPESIRLDAHELVDLSVGRSELLITL